MSGGGCELAPAPVQKSFLLKLLDFEDLLGVFCCIAKDSIEYSGHPNDSELVSLSLSLAFSPSTQTKKSKYAKRINRS